MGRLSFLVALTALAVARKHNLDLENDGRNIIDLSSFAYNGEGTLNVTFTVFKLDDQERVENNISSHKKKIQIKYIYV